MGDKRPSVRTLPTGEKVTHYPDGHQVLIPGIGPIDALLDSQEGVLHQASADLAEKRMSTIVEKQDALDAGNPVPNDKRPV